MGVGGVHPESACPECMQLLHRHSPRVAVYIGYSPSPGERIDRLQARGKRCGRMQGQVFQNFRTGERNI